MIYFYANACMHACKLATIATFMLNNSLHVIWVCSNLILCQCNVLFFKGFSMQLSVEIYLKVTKNKTIAVYGLTLRKHRNTIATFMINFLCQYRPCIVIKFKMQFMPMFMPKWHKVRLLQDRIELILKVAIVIRVWVKV